MRKDNYEEGKEAKDLLDNQKEKESKKAQTMLPHLKEQMDDHRDIILPQILKEKQRIVTRIEDFDVDCVFNEETHGNIIP